MGTTPVRKSLERCPHVWQERCIHEFVAKTGFVGLRQSP